MFCLQVVSKLAIFANIGCGPSKGWMFKLPTEEGELGEGEHIDSSCRVFSFFLFFSFPPTYSNP